MNIRELRQLIHDLPDDMAVEFAAGEEVVYIGAHLTVNEWNILYLGVDDEDLAESLTAHQTEELEEDWDDAQGDIDSPDDDEWPEDREAFMEALTKAEDTEAACGESCALPPPKTVEMNDATETM